MTTDHRPNYAFTPTEIDNMWRTIDQLKVELAAANQRAEKRFIVVGQLSADLVAANQRVSSLMQAMQEAVDNCDTCHGLHTFDKRCSRCRAFAKLLLFGETNEQ
jgi:hypothetical protein